MFNTSMLAVEVMDHYRQTWEDDRQALVAAKLVYGDPSTTVNNLLTEALASNPAYDCTMPRFSLQLLRNSYARAAFDRSPELGAFINDVVLPMAGLKPPLETAAGKMAVRPTQSPGICKSTEPTFGNTIEQIAGQAQITQARVSIYHDAQGQPLALRKYQASSSAFILQPVSLEATIIPPGVIAAIGHDTVVEETGRAEVRPCTYATYLVDEALSLKPARASAWAYGSALDRALFAVHGHEPSYTPTYQPDRGNLVEKYSLKDFRAAAHHVMEMCGVAQTAITYA